MPRTKGWVFTPDRGGTPIPEPVRRRTQERILRYAEQQFAGCYTRLDIRFHGQFCYIDAYTEPAPLPGDWPPADWPETREEYLQRLRSTPTKLCRLRYFGGEDRWGFAFYTYSNERYELSVFPSGEFLGPPEEPSGSRPGVSTLSGRAGVQGHATGRREVSNRSVSACAAWHATPRTWRPGKRHPPGRGARASMAERVDKPELVGRVARRLDRDGETVGEIVDGFLEEIYAALKGGDSVSLRGFGSFYVRAERDSWVFKFNPSQRPRALFGWSSTYRGPL